VGTHYVAQGITITCKTSVGLIDLLHNNMHHGEHQLIEYGNISHNWERVTERIRRALQSWKELF